MNNMLTRQDEQTLFFFKENETAAVESVGLYLSKELGEYTTTHTAHGIMETLRLRGFLTYCAPTEYCPGMSLHPRYRLTDIGREAMKVGYDAAIDRAAYILYLQSDA